MCFKTTASLYNSVAKELQTHIYKNKNKKNICTSIDLSMA